MEAESRWLHVLGAPVTVAWNPVAIHPRVAPTFAPDNVADGAVPTSTGHRELQVGPRRMAPAELPDRFPVEIGLRDGIGARLSAPDHDWSLQVRNVDPTQADWYGAKGVDANAPIPMTFIVPPALAMAPELDGICSTLRKEKAIELAENFDGGHAPRIRVSSWPPKPVAGSQAL